MKPLRSSLAALTLGAVGVVYGDIGTSPLYAFKVVFVSGHVIVNSANVLGILSLFFWTLTVVVSIKYVILIMRADNHGEGGLMALLALATHAVRTNPRLRNAITVLGIAGVALFFGDGVITPAISVLSAVEGLEVVSPAMHRFVLPFSLVVLLLLFMAQRRGTASLGRFFGPIMLLWFAAIGLSGLRAILQNPSVLRAVSPVYALAFGIEHYHTAFITLGAVFLSVTGAEALYADMGHFGKTPIRCAWFALVMPSLMLNYFGQGALVLAQPEAISNPFFLLAPEWSAVPMVLLATAATVIASQAQISGVFSAALQTMQLRLLPRLTVLHTSATDRGQIYVPVVNLALLVGVIIAVAVFKSSNSLAAAYGISVSLLMVITTVMTFFVIRLRWKIPLFVCVLATGLFLSIDLSFFVSNALKIADGGWFPLVMATLLFIVLITWRDGQAILARRLRMDAQELAPFLQAIHISPPVRVPGAAVFLVAETAVVPSALLHNLKHNKVFHESNLFVTVSSREVPRVPDDERMSIAPLGHQCWQVILHFGFMDEPNVPRALHQMAQHGCKLDPMTTSYFLSRDIVMPSVTDQMAPWREKIFARMHRGASAAAAFLHLPSNAVVELGSKINL